MPRTAIWLERLCRYISRPAVSEKRLSLTANGNVRYQLKTPYRDGTIYVIFEPLDFIVCIEDPVVIEKILSHLDQKADSAQLCRSPPSRAPPQAGLFDG